MVDTVQPQRLPSFRTERRRRDQNMKLLRGNSATAQVRGARHQNQTFLISNRGLDVKEIFPTSGRGGNIFLDIPLYRTSVYIHNPENARRKVNNLRFFRAL
jgi:type II secretory pathway pseudopilin PulG